MIFEVLWGNHEGPKKCSLEILKGTSTEIPGFTTQTINPTVLEVEIQLCNPVKITQFPTIHTGPYFGSSAYGGLCFGAHDCPPVIKFGWEIP